MNGHIYNLDGFWYAMDNTKDMDKLNKKKIDKKIYNKINDLLKKLNDK